MKKLVAVLLIAFVFGVGSLQAAGQGAHCRGCPLDELFFDDISDLGLDHTILESQDLYAYAENPVWEFFAGVFESVPVLIGMRTDSNPS